jgi:hypothetical protein
MRTELTRRRLVQAGVGLAVVGVGSTAGCTNPANLVGGSSYEQWLHEPGVVSEDDDYDMTFVDAKALENLEDELPSGMHSDFESYIENTTDIVDRDADEIASFLETNVSRVLTGSFDVEDIADHLDDEGYDEEDDDYEGFMLYRSDDPYTPRGVAVGGSAVVVVTHPDPIDSLEELVQVSMGDEERYVEENDEMKLLNNKLGGGMFVSARTHPERDDTNVAAGQFDHQLASGERIRVNGSTSKHRWVRVLEESDDVDMDEVEDWVDETDDDGETFDQYEDVNLSKSGRAIVVDGTVDTDELFNY